MLVAVGAAPRLLRQAGVDPAEVALAAGIDPDLFADPAAVIPFDVLDRYLVKCVGATRCPHFSLLLGAEEGFANLGIVGRLVEHSPTVAAALRNLSANFHHYELGATVTLVADDDTAMLEYAIEQRVTAPELIADGAMAIAVGILRHMCGPTWSPIEVQLRRARPASTATYRRILGERVRYGCERNALLFPARWLSHPLRGAAPDLRRFFRDQLAAMGGERHIGVPGAPAPHHPQPAAWRSVWLRGRRPGPGSLPPHAAPPACRARHLVRARTGRGPLRHRAPDAGELVGTHAGDYCVAQLRELERFHPCLPALVRPHADRLAATTPAPLKFTRAPSFCSRTSQAVRSIVRGLLVFLNLRRIFRLHLHDSIEYSQAAGGKSALSNIYKRLF